MREGDTAAFAVLVARYRDRLGRYAMQMLGDREDAEEALQDAFVRAYRSLARFDDSERFGPWLFAILVNPGTAVALAGHTCDCLPETLT